MATKFDINENLRITGRNMGNVNDCNPCIGVFVGSVNVFATFDLSACLYLKSYSK